MESRELYRLSQNRILVVLIVCGKSVLMNNYHGSLVTAGIYEVGQYALDLRCKSRLFFHQFFLWHVLHMSLPLGFRCLPAHDKRNASKKTCSARCVGSIGQLHFTPRDSTRSVNDVSFGGVGRRVSSDPERVLSPAVALVLFAQSCSKGEIMQWYTYVAYFFGGAFLVNAVPHFVNGVSGHSFPSPFASPPGKGLSSPMVNVLWGTLNVGVGILPCVPRRGVSHPPHTRCARFGSREPVDGTPVGPVVWACLRRSIGRRVGWSRRKRLIDAP